MIDLNILQESPNNPAFYMVLFTVLFAFFLSSILALTYDLTTRTTYRRAHFLQSLSLISMVAAMVMQAIGDSLARGLGMLGALAIIRFRTNLNDPRNMTFMFASLAVGISCGVFGFSIALTGTLIFCLAAFVLKWSPLSGSNELIGVLRMQYPVENDLRGSIDEVLRRYCKDFDLQEMRFLPQKTTETKNDEGEILSVVISRDEMIELNYLIRLRRDTRLADFTMGTRNIEGVHDMRVKFEKAPRSL